MATVAVDGDGDGDRGSGDYKNDGNSGNSEGSSRNGHKLEVGRIMGMDSEGMMFDDNRIGMEVTAEGICL
jgi:hypothetical protein